MHPGLADRRPTGAGRTDHRRCNRGCRSLGQAATEERTSVPHPHRHGAARARAMMTRGPNSFVPRVGLDLGACPPRWALPLPRRSASRAPNPSTGTPPARTPVSANWPAPLRCRFPRALRRISRRRPRRRRFLAPLRSDEPAPRGGRAHRQIGWRLAGRSAEASSRPLSVSLAAAQPMRARPSRSLYSESEIARGTASRITADVYRATRNVWDRARQPVPAPWLTASAAGASTARSIVPRAGSARREPVEKVTTEDRDLVAIACGDIDGDGRSRS